MIYFLLNGFQLIDGSLRKMGGYRHKITSQIGAGRRDDGNFTLKQILKSFYFDKTQCTAVDKLNAGLCVTSRGGNSFLQFFLYLTHLGTQLDEVTSTIW